MSSSVEVTIYQRPDGRKLRTLITNVRYDDARYFRDNGVIISMEEIGENDYAVYGNWNGDEEDEVIVLSRGRTCEDTLAELRQTIEEYKRNEQVSP